jgi:hypothetical protein
MARKTDTLPSEYATIKVTHHAMQRERAETLRRRPGPKSSRPECLIIGHAWTEDPARDGGLVCISCQVVRWP